MDRPIENFMEMTTQKIKELIDVDTTIGKPITAPDGTIIIPISRMTFGMISGGGEYGGNAEQKETAQDSKTESAQNSFAGGAASGVSITPVAFMIISNGDVKILPAQKAANVYDEILDRFPAILKEVKKLFPEKEQPSEPEQDPAQESQEKQVKKYVLIEEDV